MTDILGVKVTNTSFIFDFQDFQIETSKEYIKNVEDIEWVDNCLLIYADGDIESIGFEHLLFGEPPFYKSCDCKIFGKKQIKRNELSEYIENIKQVRLLS